MYAPLRIDWPDATGPDEKPHTKHMTFSAGLRTQLASADVSMEATKTAAAAVSTPPASSGVDWGRAEFVLTLLGFVGFLALPIRVTTIYDGLPAHPLFVHVPVVLIPVTIVTTIVFVAKTEWLERYGIALSLVSIVAMSSIFLSMQSGSALRAALNLQGPAATLISEHVQAAHILAYVYVLFTATLIVTFAARRISAGMPTGLALVDRPLASGSVFAALRVVLVLLAVGAGYVVFRTGDLGAKAVWEGRLQAEHRGAPPGGFGEFPPLGGPPAGAGSP
jgi:hypothetical protein